MEYNDEQKTNETASENRGFDMGDNNKQTQTSCSRKELKLPAPNANLILIFGIISILTACCVTVLAPIFGIIAIILAVKSKKEFNRNRDLYDENTFEKVETGKTCAIIGLIAGIILIIVTLIIVSNLNSVDVIDISWDRLGY